MQSPMWFAHPWVQFPCLIDHFGHESLYVFYNREQKQVLRFYELQRTWYASCFYFGQDWTVDFERSAFPM